MSTMITVLHIIVCLFLMLTVLLQSGKGGGMGAAFGGGGNAATVFGGSGASGFLKRLTAIAGTVFMITSMVLAFLSSRNSADALDSYGKDQQKIADEKEAAKARALKAAKQGAGSGSQGSGAGSASMNPIKPLGAIGSASGSGAEIEAPILPDGPGSATPKAGSATPKAGSATPVKPLTVAPTAPTAPGSGSNK